MTRRRFIADSWTATTATLTGDQAIHLARVLRAEPGQIYDIVSNGFLHRAEITSASEQRVDFTLHEELSSDTALPLHLLLAIFKFDHMEWAIEKATELGIA
ncbi:MAG: Ribosomal small subunit methyltransferase, partial [Edaphobacter sp.]|nr:Ribosomal small subunit methyltransferase [Edaphobacter sp.]